MYLNFSLSIIYFKRTHTEERYRGIKTNLVFSKWQKDHSSGGFGCWRNSRGIYRHLCYFPNGARDGDVHFETESEQLCIQITPAVHTRSHLPLTTSVSQFSELANVYSLLTLQLLDEGPGHSGALRIKHHMTLRKQKYFLHPGPTEINTFSLFLQVLLKPQYILICHFPLLQSIGVFIKLAPLVATGNPTV